MDSDSDDLYTFVQKRIDKLNEDILKRFPYHINNWNLERCCPYREDIEGGKGWYVIVEETEFEDFDSLSWEIYGRGKSSQIKGKLVSPEGKEYRFDAWFDERHNNCDDITWEGNGNFPENDVEDLEEFFIETLKEL